MIDTAQSLHPRSVVGVAGAIFRRVPRQRGVTVSGFAEIDGQTVTFVSIVTGVGDEAIVRELPEGGGAVFVLDESVIQTIPNKPSSR